jgi:hypothetical protein
MLAEERRRRTGSEADTYVVRLLESHLADSRRRRRVWSAAESGSVFRLEQQLALVSDIDKLNQDGRTALQLAAKVGILLR